MELATQGGIWLNTPCQTGYTPLCGILFRSLYGCLFGSVCGSLFGSVVSNSCLLSHNNHKARSWKVPATALGAM